MKQTDKKEPTETIASVAKGLFLGAIAEGELFPFPQIKEEEKETLQMIIDTVDKFMGEHKEDYRHYDREGAQPKEYLEALKEMGLFGLIVPEEFGGLGLTNSGYSRVLQQTSRLDASTSLTIGAHSSIGMKGLLLFGNKSQKEKYLPKLASGEMIAAFCLTEAGAGSDAASIKTTASKHSDGSWTLSGEKIWITNGAFADFFTVFAKTDTDKGKMTAFIVERAFTGVSNGPKEDKMGIRASATTTVRFDNVKVPAENVLFEEGQGFKVAMAILNNGRTGLGGGCVGAMKECIDNATKQAADRKQFGKPINSFGLIQEKLALMNVDCFAAESVVAMVGSLIDRGSEDYSIEAAISKIFATEALWRVVDEALQIAAGNGFMREYPYERVVRDSRINRIFEGTNEILRLYVALSGFKEAGDSLKAVKKGFSEIFSDPIKGFGVLTKFAGKKISQVSKIGRAEIKKIHPALKEQGEIFEHLVSRVSKSIDFLLVKLGKKIIDEQIQTKRIAECIIDLFVGLCVLSRVTAILEKEKTNEEALLIATLFTEQAKRRIESNLRRILSNEDKETVRLAEIVSQREGCKWDLF
jgi:acyl-CoA dehydrogenase family protein 9